MSERPEEARRGPGWTRAALGALLAAALLVWAAGRVDRRAVARVLVEVEPGWVLLAALAQTAALAWRGVRWHALLGRDSGVPLRAAVEATFMGWVALALLPARLGELARPWFLGRRCRTDRSFAFGAQQLERLLDLVCLLALVAAFLHGSPSPAGAPARAQWLAVLGRAEALLAGIVVAAVLGLVAAVALAPKIGRALARGAAGAAPGRRAAWILVRGHAFARGLTGIRTPGALAAAVAQSLVVWALVCAAHWSLFRAFRLDLSALAVGPLLAFAVLGALVPAPVAIGGYHAAVQVALASVLGVPLAVASSYALVSHAATYLPNLALGSWLLAAEGLSPAGPGRRGGGDVASPV